jgi:hypothetical protein
MGGTEHKPERRAWLQARDALDGISSLIYAVVPERTSRDRLYELTNELRQALRDLEP